MKYNCNECGGVHDGLKALLDCYEIHGKKTDGVAVEIVDFDQTEAVEPPVVVEPEAEVDWTLPAAPELLGRAAMHMHERSSTYDKPEGERSMGRTVQAFNAITGHNLSESEGWLLLQVLKDVRLFTRSEYHADSAEDCIAYAALKAEAKGRGL